MKKRSIIILIVAVLAVGAFFLLNQQNTLSAQDVSAVNITDEASVTTDTIQITLNSAGTIEPIQEIGLTFPTSGKVVEILADEGDTVASGDIIARLDSRQLSETLEDAQIQLQSQQIEWDALFAAPRDVDVAAAEADLLAAQLSQGGSTALSGANSINEQIQALNIELAKNQSWQSAMQRDNSYESVVSAGTNLENSRERGATNNALDKASDSFDSSELNYIQSEANLMSSSQSINEANADYVAESNRITDYGGSSSAISKQVQAEVDLANLSNLDDMEATYTKIDLELAKIAVANAEANLENTNLRAPIDGVIVDNSLVIGEVAPTVDAVTLMDTSQYYVDLPVDEIDIVNIRVGQIVSLTVDALPDLSLTGMVSQIAVMPATTGDLVTYDVRVLLDVSHPKIRAGMSVTAIVTLEEYTDVIVVPNQFITTVEEMGISFVNVLKDDGTVETTPITIGIQTNQVTQVLSGLQVGQQIVITAENNLPAFAGSSPFGAGA